MSGEAKKRKFAGKGKGKKENDLINGIIEPGRSKGGLSDSGPGICVKTMFIIIFASFTVAATVFFTGYRQGDLNELMGKVPPEVWEAKSVVETEFNKLTASVGKTVGPGWEKLKKESGPYLEKVRVGAAPVLDQVSSAAGAAKVQLVHVADAVLRNIHINI
ncbi:uncharacterized protein LOC111696318 [Eurytemora carolleeae]|uniref:uncharacterized protein LOC111696318 n=1 Tax=Eurytemora carolleeae TaxID=1294199 RepID=UPI000C76EB62|nr:uncharacterized protein LOC111696318 [Eurytemora carolleeae]|eukprot:XP_023321657.1 uncharacterized protein LOC111696318 [Eurytemora affinis]